MTRTLLALVLAVSPVLAHAESADAGARRLFAEGRAQYAASEYGKAKQSFLDAYARKQLPLLLYNAAQAARLSSDYDGALDLYRRYLLVMPDAPERAQCQHYIDELSAYHAAHAVPAPSEPTVVASPQPAPEVMSVSDAPPPPPRRSHKALVVGLTLGGIVVVGGAIALGVVLGVHHAAPSSDLGNYKPYN